MIKIQLSIRVNARDVNKVSKGAKMSSFFLFFGFTVERIEIDIGGMVNWSTLLKEPLRIFGSPEAVLPGPWQSIKCAKSHSFDCRSQHVSQNIFTHKILHFLCGRIEVKYT